MGAVAIGQHPDQRVRIIETLPDRDDLGAVVLENLDLFLTEALMEIVDATLAVARRLGGVHAKLEAARVGGHVARKVRCQLAGGHPGLLRGYTHDRESGELTLYHLKECIKALAQCPEVEAIHLIAHSRGTDILFSALRELIVRTRITGNDPQETLKIGNVIMAAPDIDLDVSSQRFSPDRLYDGYELLTVYVSAHDRAIGSAEWLFA